jgi:hypothetical protein
LSNAEARSALARRHRAGDLTDAEHRGIVTQLSEDWDELFVIDFDELLAGELAERHAIRGFDAMHLAAVLGLVSDATTEVEILFSSFDSRLQHAATAAGLRLYDGDGLH